MRHWVSRMSADVSICVAHLVRKKNGIAPLKQFLDSYHRHSPGVDHELLLILKGFGAAKLDGDIENLLKPVSHSRLFIGDWGYDISAYFRATKRFQYRYFCFLNSFSEILGDDWLLNLYRAINQENVGMVGATGSYQGYHGDLESAPKALATIKRPRWKQEVLKKMPYMKKLNLIRLRFLYPFFPNPHLRTNGFMIRRELMTSLRPQLTLTKSTAYRFEAGSRSMTNQVLSARKAILVVDKNGNQYQIDDWVGSKTFWEGDQENLMISDNQTRKYQASDFDMRELFSWFAWGHRKEQQSADNIDAKTGPV